MATEKEEKVVTVGDIVLIPAGERHWHGFDGDSEFSHIVVVKSGSKVTQLEDWPLLQGSINAQDRSDFTFWWHKILPPWWNGVFWGRFAILE